MLAALSQSSCFVLLLLSFLAWRIWVWRRLSCIPGPFWAGWSKYRLLSNTIAGRFHLDLLSCHEKYGSLVRLGPNLIVTDDFNVIKRLQAATSQYTRSSYYDAGTLLPPVPNMYSERDESRHATLRLQTAAAYAGENHQLESTINRQILALQHLIEDKYLFSSPQSSETDFSVLVNYLTTDLIGAVSFGGPFGFTSNDRDMYDYLGVTEQLLPAAAFVLNFPILARIMGTPLLRRYLLPSPDDKVWLGKLLCIGQSSVAKHYQADYKNDSDMLGSFKRHGLSAEESVHEVLFQVIAGSGTTAVAIQATIYHIASSPRIYNKLMAEIDTAEKSNQISSPIRGVEARNLPFLQACVKEGLRMYPPATGLAPKTVPTPGETINDVFLPGGTEIGISSWAMQRNKNVYGSNADVFHPERWLENPTPDMERSFELVFASGKYACPGRTLAMLAINKTLVEILRRYKVVLSDPGKPLSITSNAAFWIVKDMNVRLSLRCHHADSGPRVTGEIYSDG